MRRFPSVRKGRSQKGTRLLLYSFCLFVIKDPTFLHSRRELSKLPDSESCQVATQLYMFGMVLSSFTTANAGVTPKPTSAFCPP